MQILRKFIPNLGGTLQPRKISRSNLENLYASLNHLLSLSNASYVNVLSGHLGILYNRILHLFGQDADNCIKELKLVRRWFVEFYRGGDLSNNGLVGTRWDERQKCPKLLSDIPDFLESQDEVGTDKDRLLMYQILFSMISADRVIVTQVEPDHSTITKESTMSDALGITDEDVKLALSGLGILDKFRDQFKLAVHSFRYEILSTRGPNGQQTWSANSDAEAWGANPSLWLKFRAFLEEIGFMGMINSIVTCAQIDQADLAAGVKRLLGKLAYIEEWGGKCRIVAQLDYWTQMALTPLHETINHFLKEIVMDGTFSQTRVANIVQVWTKDIKNELYSYDLTAATDRLPIELQMMILKALWGSSSFADNWAAILNEREFMTNTGDCIKYAVGQPMGARSSFPMLALTHHVIIKIAAANAGVKNFTNYVVVGDDSVINSRAVADEYVKLMAQLGVSINLTKSVLWNSEYGNAAEICKRVFVDGLEVTGLNPKLIVKTIKDGKLAPALQNDLLMRGWDFSDTVFWTWFAAMLDREALELHIKLNMVPTAISGLTKAISVPGNAKGNTSTWFPGISLTTEDIIQLHTFVSASEQLKRLDAILRNANVVLMAIMESAGFSSLLREKVSNPYSAWPGMTEPQFVSEREGVLSRLGSLNPTHPVVLASESESQRLGELLLSLNSLDSNMVYRARQGMLDMFHTPLEQLFGDTTETRAAQDRALFLKTLRAISDICLMEPSPGALHFVRRLDYSVVLTMTQRLWSVTFTLGSKTLINSVTAKVAKSRTEASNILNNVVSGINFGEASPTVTLDASRPSQGPRQRRRRPGKGPS